MTTESSAISVAPARPSAERVAVPILAAISVSHLLNDLMQSLLPAIYPILKSSFHLDFGQIGLLTLTFQMHRLAAAAPGRHLHRPPAAALLARRRHGLHPRRSADAVAAPGPTRCCCSPRPWSAWAPRSSIRNPPASRAWPRAGGTAWRNRCSRSAAMRVRRSGRCSPPSSSCRSGSEHRLVLRRGPARDG